MSRISDGPFRLIWHVGPGCLVSRRPYRTVVRYVADTWPMRQQGSPAGTSSDPAPQAERPKPRSAAGGRLRALDGLRLVAALMVAGYHYLALDHAASAWGQDPDTVFPTADALAPYGWLGVEIFFVISGFVICMSCWGRTLGDFPVTGVPPLPGLLGGSRPHVSGDHRDPGSCSGTESVGCSRQPDHAAGSGRRRAHGQRLLDALGRDALLPDLCADRLAGLTYRRVIAFGLVWTIVAPIAELADFKLLTVVAMPSFAPYFLVGIGLYLLHRFGHQLLTWMLIAVNLVLSLHYAILRMVCTSQDVVHQPLHSWIVAAIFLGGVAVVFLIGQGRLAWVQWRWMTVAGVLPTRSTCCTSASGSPSSTGSTSARAYPPTSCCR